ncbi:MAG: AI-2E family transporter [Planctomycetes bacterium]|nr:AI-2E family transporter [Planctomycetota bacterium]
MQTGTEPTSKTLPPPWDRIFSLGTRTFVWVLLIAVLYLLRPFFLLIFMTFVFAYIQAHGVEGLAHRIRHRVTRVIIVGLVVLGTLFATGFTLWPQVRDQAETFLKNKDDYIAQGDKELNKFLRAYPSVYNSLLKHQQSMPDPTKVFGATEPPGTGPATGSGEAPTGAEQPHDDVDAEAELRRRVAQLEQAVKSLQATPAVTPQAPPKNDQQQESKPPEELHFVRDVIASLGKSLTQNPLEIVPSVLGYVGSFLLSLLFSFLIVLDLPKITRGVQSLAKTRVGFIYEEVADNFAGFGRVLGRALEAQLFIAICNTILTAIGIWLMGLPNMLVLSAIVFFCSFIPVVGTIISSVPICLLALQSGGVGSMLLAILLINGIHALETYVLNPQIYGHHMHMNPVFVLIVLTVGGKLFGVWGLVLGIPIVNYFFRHAIRLPEQKPKEVSAES